MTINHINQGDGYDVVRATLNSVIDTVNQAPVISVHPTSQSVMAGATVTFISAAAGIPAPTVKWQKSTDAGVTWADIQGAISASLSVTVALSDNAARYRAVWTNGNAPVATNAAVLTVTAATVAPSVTTHPTAKSVTVGTAVTFTSAATGTPAPTVQYQKSTDNGSTWSDISGAQNATYSLTPTLADTGTLFRAKWSNSAGPAYSNSALLTVTAAASGTGKPWDIVTPTPTIDFSDVTIAPGATYVHIKLRLSRAPFRTVMVCFGLSTVSGGSVNNISTYVAHLAAPEGLNGRTAIVWRPGDDQDHYVSIPIKTPISATGLAFQVLFGGSLGGHGYATAAGGNAIKVYVAADAVNELPGTMPFHRAPKKLSLAGAVAAYNENMANIKWSDTGYADNAASGTPVWMSRLPHGYAQSGNGETGAYLNSDKFPANAISPQTKGTDSNGRPYARLHTQRLPGLVQLSQTEYYQYQASVITGQRIDALCKRRGLWRCQMVSPDRQSAWAAFWLIGRSDTNSSSYYWPPEIDILEHFNGVYGLWDADRWTSSALHYGEFGSNVRAGADGGSTDLTKVGFDPAVKISREIHDYACLVEDDFIYVFFDNVEVMCFTNIMNRPDGATNWCWFPIINVAVKGDINDPYDQGNGDMLVYGIQFYDQGSGYTLGSQTGVSWANGKILPEPDGPFPPKIATAAATVVGEERAVSLQLVANETCTWALEPGGADNALFSINSTGLLTFAAKDFENPTDANTDNVYEYKVRATSVARPTHFVTQARKITVQDRPEGLPPQQLTTEQQVVSAPPWEPQSGTTLIAQTDGYYKINGSGFVRLTWAIQGTPPYFGGIPYDGFTYSIEVYNPTGAAISFQISKAYDASLITQSIPAGATVTISGVNTTTYERAFGLNGNGLWVRNPAVRPRWI